MNNYDYPLGADNESAPWNEETPKKHEIEVTISLCLSKTVTIVTDNVETDDEGNITSYGYLYDDVASQITLPNNLARFVDRMFEHDLDLKAAGMSLAMKNAIKDCSDWNVDEFDVIPE